LLFGQAHGVTSILAENGLKVGMSERLKDSNRLADEGHESQRKFLIWECGCANSIHEVKIPPVLYRCENTRVAKKGICKSMKTEE